MSVVQNTIYYLLLPVLLGCGMWFVIERDNAATICHTDYTHNEMTVCRASCKAGQFSLPWMDECRQWLTCRDIESPEFKIAEAISGGAVKKVYRATWQTHPVVYNHLAETKYKPDFKHGLRMLINYQPSPFVTQLIGYCKDAFVMEYHPLMSADHLEEILSSPMYEQYNTISVRFSLCINYIQILEFLHSHPKGPRVMCDSNDIQKTLEQFLLTNDLKLVLNDLDALPLVDKAKGKKIKCGHRELYGDFVAPEQQWPYDDREFSDKDMPGYDEKTDIWKIPDVCEHFFGSVLGSDPVRFKLFKIDQQCKRAKPELRPNATEVLEEYIKAQEEFDLL